MDDRDILKYFDPHRSRNYQKQALIALADGSVQEFVNDPNKYPETVGQREDGLISYATDSVNQLGRDTISEIANTVPTAEEAAELIRLERERDILTTYTPEDSACRLS